MILIVGLGNIGLKYQITRHNIGFMAVDHLSTHHKLAFHHKTKFNSEIAEGFINEHKLLLAKPMTYMNLSGNSVQSISSYYNIKLKNIYVIHDDIDLNVGKIKCKLGGGNAGHNGLRSIDQRLGNGYYRIRIGIGRPLDPRIEIADYVLSPFMQEEYKVIIRSVEKMTDNINLLLSGKLEEFKKKIAL